MRPSPDRPQAGVLAARRDGGRVPIPRGLPLRSCCMAQAGR